MFFFTTLKRGMNLTLLCLFLREEWWLN
jgi:hypothetical protein